jgi:hypothetical protein
MVHILLLVEYPWVSTVHTHIINIKILVSINQCPMYSKQILNYLLSTKIYSIDVLELLRNMNKKSFISYP